MNLRGHTMSILTIRFSPDGSSLATSSGDGTIRLWDISPAGSREVFTLGEHQTSVRDIAYSPDDARLATASDDGKVMIWDGATGKLLHTLSHSMGRVNAVAFSPDGMPLVSSGEDFAVRVWDVDTGNEVMTWHAHEDVQGEELDYKIGGIYQGVIPVSYSPDGRLIASAGEDGTARIWDAQNGTLLHTLNLHPNGNGGTNLKFSSDGSRLATATDIAGPKKVPGGDLEALVIIWDVATGRDMLTLKIPQRIWGLDFSPDGNQLATSGSDGYIMIWDAHTGTELFTLPGHSSTVKSVAYSPDGSRLATAAGDLIRVWDLASRQTLITLPGPSLVSAVNFNSDGSRLANSSLDGTARVYTLDVNELMSIANNRLTRWFTLDECRQYLHLEECPPR
jgi:WD40 repeat protein